jgi:hypothetical protein
LPLTNAVGLPVHSPVATGDLSQQPSSRQAGTRLGLTRLVTEARDRLHTLIANAMADQHIPEQLDAILEQSIDQVDADPELRRQVVRESLRSSLFSTFWLR